MTTVSGKLVSQNRSGGRSRLWMWGLILLVTGVGTAGYLTRDRWVGRIDRKAAAEEPGSARVRRYVSALGRLEPAGTVIRLAPKSGNEGASVESLLVVEGEDVYAGKTVAVLDTRDRRAAAVAEAEARVALAEANLQKVQAGAKRGDIQSQEAAAALADQQSKVALRDLNRARKLVTSDAVSEELLEQRQWEYDRLRLEYQRLSNLVESTREIRAVDVAAAEQEIAVAKAAAERARAELQASEVRAPISGRVLKIHTRSGERVSDRGILEMGAVADMQAVAEVFEADIPLIRIGQKAEVVIDSSGENLLGTVIEIGHLVARKIVLTNDPVSDTDARVIEVRIQLSEGDRQRVERLSNSRVEVRIELDDPVGGPSKTTTSQEGAP